MSELKPCPKCNQCSLGSNTSLVNLDTGIHYKCLWCEKTTPANVSDLHIDEQNKTKAEAVREAKYSCSYDDIGNDCFDGEIKVCLAMDLEDHANKLERGEV